MPHTAEKRLIETITKQLERVDYFSSAENISPNVAVHEIRKTFKRLRALLKFYSDFPDEFSPDFERSSWRSSYRKPAGRALPQNHNPRWCAPR